MRLKSRYPDVHTEVDMNTGVITTDSYVRIGHNDSGVQFIDFDGGPFIQLGDVLVEGGPKVKKIVQLEKGYKFEFYE